MSSWADKFNWLVSVLPDALAKSGASAGLSGSGPTGHYAKWTGASSLGDGGAIPATSCTITQSLTPPASVNLTSEGALDWMFFNGLSANLQPAQQPFTMPLKKTGWGMGLWFRWFDGGHTTGSNSSVASTAVSFSDGDNVPSGSGLTNQRGVTFATAGQAGFGYSFSVPALSTSRTLRIYGAIRNGTATLTVALPDGSTFNDSISGGATDQGYLWTIVYSSAVASTARVSIEQTTNSGNGVCSFMAATLAAT